MNGYLLVIKMTFDDLPLRLFATLDELRDWWAENETTIATTIAKCADRIEWGCSDLVIAEAVQFRNGCPVGSEVISDLSVEVE